MNEDQTENKDMMEKLMGWEEGKGWRNHGLIMGMERKRKKWEV